MQIKNIFIILSLATIFMLSACKQRKQVQRAKADEKHIVTPASFNLFDSLKTHRFKYSTMAAKIKTDFTSNDGTEINLMITMRAVNDSAIWMSASLPLGIEAARILFTRDTIKIMDRIHRQYATESYSFLKRFSEADISFDILQNILCGNPAFINSGLKTDSITNYYFAHCNQATLLEQLTATRTFRLFENIITDKNNNDKINISYSDLQYIEYEYLPFDIRIAALSKGKTATILLNYSNIAINLPVDIKFNIPSGYTKMNY